MTPHFVFNDAIKYVSDTITDKKQGRQKLRNLPFKPLQSLVDRDKQRAVITENCDSESRPQKIKIKIKTFSKPCDTPQLTPTRLDSVTAQKRQAAPIQLLVPECATTQESAS